VPKLRKAFALSALDWILIVQATLWFAVVAVGLRLLQLRTVLAILHGEKRSDRNSRSHSTGIASGNPQRAAYCVELASRLYPLRPTCLQKALVLYALLARRGFDVRVLIGAARDGIRLDAHAWLEHQGRIILGAPTPGRYSTLCALEKSLAGTRPQGEVAS
jgi:hypothetical protein